MVDVKTVKKLALPVRAKKKPKGGRHPDGGIYTFIFHMLFG